MKNSKDNIGNRIGDLPAGSVVPWYRNMFSPLFTTRKFYYESKIV